MKTGKKRLTGTLLALCAALLVLCIVLAIGWSKTAKADAELPEVRNNGTAVQWKYRDETDWRDLVALTELRGAAGENGRDGANGSNGADGKNGINGTNGKDGMNGVDGRDGANGENGTDGKNGINGANGKDGINGIDGTDGQNGIDGKDGTDGQNGIDGTDGVDGKDGVNAKNIEVQRAESYIQWRYEGGEWQNLVAIADIEGPAGQNGGSFGYFAANGRVYSWGTPLPFNVKKESGDLISYDASSKTITLSKGHTYSMVFSGTVMISANGNYKLCGASLIDGYNSSEMMLETRTYVSMINDGQSARLGMSYNTIYRAEADIALTFQYTNMLFQNTNFTDSQYNITIIALD